MLKNNIKAILIHICISVLFISINRVGYLETIYSSNKTFGIFLSVLFCPIYVLLSFLFIKDVGSKSKNFLSSISIVMVGIIIWAICFNLTDYVHLYTAYGDDGFVYEWWTYHDMIWQYYYNGLLPFLTVAFPIQIITLIVTFDKKERLYDIINLYLVFIPSVFIFIGVTLRNRKDRRKMVHRENN